MSNLSVLVGIQQIVDRTLKTCQVPMNHLYTWQLETSHKLRNPEVRGSPGTGEELLANGFVSRLQNSDVLVLMGLAGLRSHLF